MADDVRQLIRLLWRTGESPAPARRGPAKRVTVDQVVDAAIRRADDVGLDALSIRALASDLGLGPMSLYTYVPSRDVLLGLMVDAVASDDCPFGPEDGLAAALMAIGHGLLDEYRRHPWLLDVPMWRDVLGPHRLRRYERQLERLEPYPFTDLERDHVIGAISSIASGAARAARDAGGVAARSGLTDAQWWEIAGPELESVMVGEDFPLAGRVGTAVGEFYGAPSDPGSSFDFAMSRFIAGVENLVTERGYSQ